MKKILNCIILPLIFTLAAFAGTAEESFKKNFPVLRYDAFSPSPIQGLYEVMNGDLILYYDAGRGHVFVGEIITKEGRNITQEKLQALIAAKLSNIDLGKALKIGSGKIKLIEFANPDSDFCRKAEKYLARRADLTRFIFFVPLTVNVETRKKIKFIFCAGNKNKAWEDAMTGKLDDLNFSVCDDEAVDELMNDNETVGRQVGIKATPYFFVNGTAVLGADIPRLRAALEDARER